MNTQTVAVSTLRTSKEGGGNESNEHSNQIISIQVQNESAKKRNNFCNSNKVSDSRLSQ